MVVGGVNNKRVTLDEPDVFPYTGACNQAIPNMFRERYDLHLIEDINWVITLIYICVQIWPQFVSPLRVKICHVWRLLSWRLLSICLGGYCLGIVHLCIVGVWGEILDKTL